MRHFQVIPGVFLICAACAAATTYTVNPDGSGDFPTIQAGITAASDGDIIELHV